MKGLTLLALMIFSTTVFADTYVRGHYRKNGTYVKGHYRSTANHTRSDNWSTRGNVNPYTGKRGTRSYSGSSYGNSFNSNYGSKSKSNSIYGW